VRFYISVSVSFFSFFGRDEILFFFCFTFSSACERSSRRLRVCVDRAPAAHSQILRDAGKVYQRSGSWFMALVASGATLFRCELLTCRCRLPVLSEATKLPPELPINQTLSGS
jgi:hypothetical protein